MSLIISVTDPCLTCRIKDNSGPEVSRLPAHVPSYAWSLVAKGACLPLSGAAVLELGRQPKLWAHFREDLERGSQVDGG